MLKKLKSKSSRKSEENVELVQVDRSDALSLSTLESGHVIDLSRNVARSGAAARSDAGSEISAGPEKWRRIRRGHRLSYMPFDIEDYQDLEESEHKRDETFPPLSETADLSKNWPKNCPFVHLKFKDFAIIDKQKFIKTAYYFWYFLVFVLLWNIMGAIIASLLSPSPSPDSVYIAFLIGFFGFWWFFFGHFRLLYFAMRYRKTVMYSIYQLETVCLVFISIYMVFSLLGNMTQLLAPLAPGSPVPVRQKPTVPTVVQSIGIVFWLIIMMYCFYFIRKAHYFKFLPLALEKEMWLKELEPGYAELQKKKFSQWLVDLFREKPDKPQPPVRCGMLQGVDLWLQGQLTLETVFLEFKADVHIFDHLVWERFHYQEILDIRKYSDTGILFRAVNPSKKDLEDIELVFDYNDRKLRTIQYKAVRKLWRRVGRNMDLLGKLRTEKMMKMRRPVDSPEADLVEAFTKARRKETRERLDNHLVTYRDWQKLLGGVKIHILEAGEALLSTGDDFNKLYHLAQGRIEVSEIADLHWELDERTLASALEVDSIYGGSNSNYKHDPAQLEAKTWERYSEARNRRLLQEERERKSSIMGHSEIEYEDPMQDNYKKQGPLQPFSESKDSDESSEEEEEGHGKVQESDYSSEVSSVISSSMYSSAQRAIEGPDSVLLGTLRKDDIFGVVPFLLSRGDQIPKSGLTFVARDPITVVFSIDADFTKREVLKPKKDVTSAFYKYLAVILGERTEAAEDAMFMRKVREKRLEVARAEEAQLAQRRQAEEEMAFTKNTVNSSNMQNTSAIRNLFNLSAAEDILYEHKGHYTFRDQTDPQKRVIKAPGTFYVTNHYFAFSGKKFIDAAHMEINRPVMDVIRHDEVISIKFEGKKGVLFTDIKLDRKMFEPKTIEERDNFHQTIVSKWRSENEVTSKEMRKLLRRKMTRLSLGYLNQAERLTQQSIEGLMADMTEREKKQLFAGSVPIGLNRNQVVIGEHNFNDNLFLLCTGIVRVQRVQEHAENALESGRAMDRVVFQEIHSGQIFGFDSFLTGAPAYSSIVVDSEKCVVRSCTKEQIMARLREDRKLCAKFYSVAAVSLAARLSELSPLDLFL